MSDRYTTMRLESYGAGGKIVNPDQGTIPGARIDEAVERAVEAFWQEVSRSFSDATDGGLAPGDDIEFHDAALRIARVWVMWNVPGGMPEEVGDPIDRMYAEAFMEPQSDESLRTDYARSIGATVEDVLPGTPEWDQHERDLEQQRKRGG